MIKILFDNKSELRIKGCDDTLMLYVLRLGADAMMAQIEQQCEQDDFMSDNQRNMLEYSHLICSDIRYMCDRRELPRGKVIDNDGR